MLQLKGCMWFFMKYGGSKTDNIYEQATDDYELELKVVQDAFFSKGTFQIYVHFLNTGGESYSIESSNLSPRTGGTVFWGWDEKKSVHFEEVELCNCNLYEDTVKAEAESIIKNHMNDLMAAVDSLINDYKEHQNKKEKSFKEKTNRGD